MFVQYILPAIIIALIAGVLAFLLAFLAKKLAVDKDERIDQVKDCLAGANCGGCGYPGCSAYAEALVKGETDLSQCMATDKSSKEQIGEILGVKVEEQERTVAVVHCMGGNNCNTKYTYQGYYSCESEELLVGGCKTCSSGCLGLGTCKASCPYHAIKIKDGVAVIDYKKCRSCGGCIVKCPKLLIDRIPLKAKVFVACSSHCKGKEVMGACKKGCIGCGKCARVCPKGAITMQDNLPVIDYSKCSGCGTCVTDCPRKCILSFPQE